MGFTLLVEKDKNRRQSELNLQGKKYSAAAKGVCITLCDDGSSPLIPTTSAPAFLNFSQESRKAHAYKSTNLVNPCITNRTKMKKSAAIKSHEWHPKNQAM